jgi:acyl carrier protein
MNPTEVEREVERLFRQTALGGSTREVSLDEPLGESGLGLDSLALVSFVTAYEKRFSVRVSDELWFDRGQISLRTFAGMIAEGGVAGEKIDGPQGHSGPEGEAVAKKSAFGIRLWKRVCRIAHSRQSFVLLERDLEGPALPACALPDRSVFREATADELAAVAASWPAFRDRSPMPRWLADLAGGASCLGVWQDGRVVALDWLSGVGEEDSSLGLPIRVRPGTCYGFRLLEHPNASRGSGFALLACSLHETRRRGFRRQVTFVDGRNARMLSASVQLLGFRPFGNVSITKVFGLRRTAWRVAEQVGHGGTLVL